MAGAATDVYEWLSCVLKGMACLCFPQCLQTLTGKFLLIMPKCVERYLRSEIICTFFGACGVFLFFKEIPPDLVCDINRDCANTFIKFLLEKQKWPEVLLLLTRKVNGEPPLGDCLLKGCNFSDLDLCALIPRLSAWDPRRMQLLGCLIDSGGEKARDEHWRLVPGMSGHRWSWGFHLVLEIPLNVAPFFSSGASHFATVARLMPCRLVLACRNSLRLREFHLPFLSCPLPCVRNLRCVEGPLALGVARGSLFLPMAGRTLPSAQDAVCIPVKLWHSFLVSGLGFGACF